MLFRFTIVTTETITIERKSAEEAEEFRKMILKESATEAQRGEKTTVSYEELKD